MKLKELQSKITPLPWRVEGQYIVNRNGAITVAEVTQTPQRDANADMIVHAANHFPALTLALERITEKVARANAIQHSGGTIELEDWSELYQLANEARAALAAAQEVEI